MKLLAIDGNSIINRAFYGIKLLSAKNGQYTNAVYGFINILLKLCDEVQPDAVAVAFDLKAPTFRHKEYADYKAGRKGMPDELASQMPIMKDWLKKAGYTCLECEGYEADDILGTLCDIADKSGNECFVATGDRDSLQLISDNCRVILTATKMGRPEVTFFDRETLMEKYSMTPEQMIDLKALMGDSSDNIPGVAGIGQKTATDLIARFGSLDSVYENLSSEDIKDSVRNKLEAGRDSAYLSRWLGTICREVPISRHIEDYKIQPRDEYGLGRLMSELELFKLMERLNVKAVPILDESEEKEKQEKICISVSETLDFKKQICILNSNGEFTACDGNNVCVLSKEEALKIFADSDISKWVYDSKAYYNDALDEGYEISDISFDALLAAYLVSPSASSYELDRLIAEHSVILPETCGLTEQQTETVKLYFICKKLQQLIEEHGMSPLLCDIELPLSRVLAEMEHEGFLVDTDGISNMGAELDVRIKEIQQEVYSLVGYDFNLNSPKQLGEALFEKLKLPFAKKTKTGYSTNADVLEKLRDEHPAVPLILNYRQLAKLKSTYCDGLINAVSSDGRIHSTFNQTETRTGRISSLEPNLQNIPVRTEEGRRLRRYFVAKEGYVLCDADYSQIELRVLAHISEDENMLNAFDSDVDIHALTASEVFNMPIAMVPPLMRSRAKAVNFGIVYGIGAFSLAKDIGVTRAEADSYIKGYLATYPKVDRYMQAVIENAKETGFVSTMFGRRRYLPELSASNGMLRAFGERVARNMPIQGTAADIIKIAMVKVRNRLKNDNINAKLILQVHDELIIEAKESEKETVCRILKEEMENAAILKCKLIADVECGQTWYDAKG